MRPTLKLKIDRVRFGNGIFERRRQSPRIVFRPANERCRETVRLFEKFISSTSWRECVKLIRMAGNDVFEVQSSGCTPVIRIKRVEARSVNPVNEGIDSTQNSWRRCIVSKQNRQVTSFDGKSLYGFDRCGLGQ